MQYRAGIAWVKFIWNRSPRCKPHTTRGAQARLPADDPLILVLKTSFPGARWTVREGARHW